MKVDLLLPLGKLGLKIIHVPEPALLEERALDPLHEVFHRSLLPRPVRPADLGDEPDLKGCLGKDGVPLGDDPVLLPLQGDRFRPVKDRAQGHSAKALEVIQYRPDEDLHLLVRHQVHLHPARPLQP